MYFMHIKPQRASISAECSEMTAQGNVQNGEERRGAGVRQRRKTRFFKCLIRETNVDVNMRLSSNTDPLCYSYMYSQSISKRSINVHEGSCSLLGEQVCSFFKQT